jgi:hypothetical protein
LAGPTGAFLQLGADLGAALYPEGPFAKAGLVAGQYAERQAMQKAITDLVKVLANPGGTSGGPR